MMTEILDKSIDGLIHSLLDEFHGPSLSIAVVDEGRITSKAYGIARFPDEAATPDTLYYAGSTTKAFLSAALGVLVHDPNRHSDVKWTSPLKQFLGDDFVLQHDYMTNHMTIEDALSHRSGLPRHEFAHGSAGRSATSLVRSFRHLPLTSEPRTRFHYNNLGFAAAAEVLERVADKDVGQVLQEMFWDPLGMKSTYWSMPAVVKEKDNVERMARGYVWVEDNNAADTSGHNTGGRYVAEPYYDLASISGAGSIISTVNDYALWIRALLDAAHPPRNDRTSTPNDPPPSKPRNPISPTLFKSLITPRAILETPEDPSPLFPQPSTLPTPDLYGLSLFRFPSLFPTSPHPIIGHGGSLYGFGTEFYLVPTLSFGVVVMCNAVDAATQIGQMVAFELIARKLGLSAEERKKLIEARKKQIYKEKGEKAKPPERKFKEVEEVLERRLALPHELELSSFRGRYQYAGYGTYEVIPLTAAEVGRYNIVDPGQHLLSPLGPDKSNVADDAEQVGYLLLHAEGHPRTLKPLFLLQHISALYFRYVQLMPHGELDDDVVQGLPEGWPHDGKRGVVYDVNSDVPGGAGFEVETVVEDEGKAVVVKRLGVRMEPDMLRSAETWEDSLIWFDRVGS